MGSDKHNSLFSEIVAEVIHPSISCRLKKANDSALEALGPHYASLGFLSEHILDSLWFSAFKTSLLDTVALA